MSLKPENQIDYIELPTADTGRAKVFYSAVFGWKFQDYGTDYTSFSDGRLAGGFTKGVLPPSRDLLLVLYSSDLEAVQKKIEASGGKIVKDTFDFPGGRRFHFTDPDGNELAVWSE